MKINFNFAPGTKVTLAANGQTETVDLWSRAHKLFQGQAGRINVYDQQMSNPSTGTAIARADGKTTLNAVAETNPVEVEVSLPQDRKGMVRLAARGQSDGFSTGEGYWLAQDANGKFKVTPGRRHRKIYVTGAATAMTKAKIATHAGVAESAVTGAWLVARPIYGGTPDMAVDAAVYMLLAQSLYGKDKEPRSDWIRFERGYTYPLIRPEGSGDNTQGESELHPLVFEDYGTGEWPIIDRIEWTNMGPKNILFRNLRTPVLYLTRAVNIIQEGGYSDGSTYHQISLSENITLKDMPISNHRRTAPKDGREKWDGSVDRISGSFMSEVRNLIAVGLLVDSNGWGEGYDFNQSGTSPQPPSDRNHGLYWTHNCRNLTLRDLIISRNASCGFQIRCGGHFERILFLYNNIVFGGDAEPFANFTTLLDSVAFGAGHKKVSSYQGGLAWGYDLGSKKAVSLGNVIAHDANPDDPAEIAARTTKDFAYKGQPGTDSLPSSADWFYNDTQTYKWGKGANENVGGLSQTVLNETTIQRYAAAKLGKPTATVADLVDHARQEGISVKTLVQDIVRWVKARFGSPLPAVRTAAANLVFLPDWRTEGFRWDNRRNWSTFDLPGVHVADSVDLDGNFVRFGTLTTQIGSLKFKGGSVEVASGQLTPASIADAADIRVRGSGQIVVPATTQPVSIKADNGLTTLAGAVTKLDMEVRGHAEVLLGADATVPGGKRLLISGQRPLVGWDGTGTSKLTIANGGKLAFRVGVMVTGTTGQEQPFMSTGIEVTGTNFKATIADYQELSRGANCRLWLSDLTGLPQAAETYSFNYRQEYAPKIPRTATVGAVASRGISMLQRFRSGTVGDGLTEPTVTATVTLAAGSQIEILDRDLLLPGSYDLTGAGVTVVDNGATLPAGVSVTGGKLVLTVS